MQNTHPVTFDTFETIVDTHPLVMLDFWADWCAPCRIFAPVFEEVAARHPEIFFGKVDTERATELAQAFQVRSIPTLMAFVRGELVFEQPGVFSPGQLHELAEHLKASLTVPDASSP